MSLKNRIKVKCSFCNTEIEKCPCHLKITKNFFCSRNCHYLWKKGKSDLSEKGRKALSYAMEERWKNLDYKKRVGEKISITVKECWKDPNYKEKASNAMEVSAQQRWSDLEYRAEHGKNLSDSFSNSSKHKEAAISNFKLATQAQQELRKDPEWVMKWVEACNSSTRTKHFYSAKNDKLLYYHSTWELQAFNLLEQMSAVKSYDRCHFAIKYEFEGKNHWYIPDILITYQNDGQEIIEVKPEFRLNDSRVKSKIESGQYYCLENGLQFNVWSERELFS